MPLGPPRPLCKIFFRCPPLPPLPRPSRTVPGAQRAQEPREHAAVGLSRSSRPAASWHQGGAWDYLLPQVRSRVTTPGALGLRSSETQYAASPSLASSSVAPRAAPHVRGRGVRVSGPLHGGGGSGGRGRGAQPAVQAGGRGPALLRRPPRVAAGRPVRGPGRGGRGGPCGRPAAAPAAHRRRGAHHPGQAAYSGGQLLLRVRQLKLHKW